MNPFMQRALSLAQSQLGQTWPNPSVGAVIVRDNHIIGVGATQKGGRPHAETIALAQAGEGARGATLYVTLEPCNHHGKTPPCVDAVIAAGISEVVIACIDTNPVARGGMQRLQEAGICVSHGMGEEEGREILKGFFSVVEKKRPFISLKVAASRDGKIASSRGIRTNITGNEAQNFVHHLRAEHDAILTGIGTVLADDPQLNVRIPGMEHRSPVRVLLDSHDRLPANANLRKGETPLWVYTRGDDIIADLTARGITSLMVEAGQGVNDFFLKNNLIDRLYLVEAPGEIGPQGLDAFTGGLAFLRHWTCRHEQALGNDRLRLWQLPA